MTTWTAIVPIKPWAIAKARLDLLPQHRKELARAFSLDIIDAVTSADRVGAVVIVSAERGVQALARTLNAAIVEDRPLLEADPLNRAVMLGAHWGRAMRPQSPVVVVPADLPAMSAAALDDALVQLEEHRSAFVPDRRGTGTTLLAARRPHQMRVAFGAASASEHRRLGHVPIASTDPAVRCDVDVLADLEAARSYGLGRHTLHACATVVATAGHAGRSTAHGTPTRLS
jgi:2-phospho-L-lactate guanylyltransferase